MGKIQCWGLVIQFNEVTMVWWYSRDVFGFIFFFFYLELTFLISSGLSNTLLIFLVLDLYVCLPNIVASAGGSCCTRLETVQLWWDTMSVWKFLPIEKPKILWFCWWDFEFGQAFCIGFGWLILETYVFCRQGSGVSLSVTRDTAEISSIHTCTVLELQ